jgi:hypothetical protein
VVAEDCEDRHAVARLLGQLAGGRHARRKEAGEVGEAAVGTDEIDSDALLELGREEALGVEVVAEQEEEVDGGAPVLVLESPRNQQLTVQHGEAARACARVAQSEDR